MRGESWRRGWGQTRWEPVGGGQTGALKTRFRAGLHLSARARRRGIRTEGGRRADRLSLTWRRGAARRAAGAGAAARPARPWPRPAVRWAGGGAGVRRSRAFGKLLRRLPRWRHRRVGAGGRAARERGRTERGTRSRPAPNRAAPPAPAAPPPNSGRPACRAPPPLLAPLRGPQSPGGSGTPRPVATALADHKQSLHASIRRRPRRKTSVARPPAAGQMPADRRARPDLRPGKSWRSTICGVTAPGSRFGVTRVPAPQKPPPSTRRDTYPQHAQLLPKPSGLRLAHLGWVGGERSEGGRAAVPLPAVLQSEPRAGRRTQGLLRLAGPSSTTPAHMPSEGKRKARL